MASDNKTLKERILRGGVWSIGGHFISQAIRLAGNLISTRLLVPEMFGVMVIANVFFIGLKMFSDLGIQQNIVQSRQGDEPVFLNTAWTVQIIRGLLLTIIVLLLSGALYIAGQQGWIQNASVYADPSLPYVIAVLSLTALIGGLESTKMATLRRKLTLGHLTMLEILSQFAGPAMIIAWCYFVDRSIWALVAGWIAVSVTRMLLSHLMLPGVSNKLAWDKACFKSLYSFGKWVFLSSILSFLLNNGDRILFGAYLNSNQLGIYSIAFLMVSSMEGLLRKLLSGISFPALSEIYRNEPHRLGEVFYRLRLPSDLVSLFLVGLILTGGQAVIDLLYDDRYREAGWMLEILTVSLFFTRYEVSGLCYLVLGKPKLLTLINFIRAIAVYVSVPLAFEHLDFKWAIWVVACNYLVALPFMFYFNMSYGFFDLKKELKVLPMLLIGLLSGYVLSISLAEIVKCFTHIFLNIS